MPAYLDTHTSCPHLDLFWPPQGASTLGVSLHDYLMQLKAAGLGSLPGTAAEVLDGPVRSALCPDKLTTQEWLDVVETGAGAAAACGGVTGGCVTMRPTSSGWGS